MSSLVRKTDNFLEELQNTQKLCKMLMDTPHYRKMGPEGVFAIVEKAKSIGISPMSALNGGMFFVQGKVEMTSSMMNELIRNAGHSITKDRKSDDSICILHGKRKDNGDTWTESFSIEDAKLAGIYRNQWLKYPRDMLFARSLSRLARQLFPDVIKGSYVEGEIQIESTQPQEGTQVLAINTISDEQHEELEKWLDGNLDLRKNILTYMKDRWKIESMSMMPLELYESALSRAKSLYEEPKEESA